MVNNQQQISPVSISADCLNSTKYFVLRDAFGALETATPELRQVLNQMTQEHIQMAEDWFRLMKNRGWYQVPQANANLVNQAFTHIQSISNRAFQGQVNPQQQQQQQPQQQQVNYQTRYQY